jgi:hypothetical protein
VLVDIISKIQKKFRSIRTNYVSIKPSKHFIQIGGKKPSGLGNEIFEFGKAHIARSIVPGKLLNAYHKNSIHSVPEFLREYSKKSFRFQLILSRIFNRLLVIDRKLFIEAATLLSTCDYGTVFSHLQKINPTKRDFLHASGMVGGYLSIASFRTELRSILGLESVWGKRKLIVSFHIRGPVLFRNRPWSVHQTYDFAPEKVAVGSGDFNSETPLKFYLSVVEGLAQIKSVAPLCVKIVTNMRETDHKISEITKSLAMQEIEHEIVTGDPLDALKTLIDSDLIIPSISSFSLLAIFLSDARYFWPRAALCSNQGFFSIWGYESNQWLAESVSRARIESKKLSRSQINAIRGLPFPSLHGANLSQWILSKDSNYRKEFDLVFYGEVPSDLTTDMPPPIETNFST